MFAVPDPGFGVDGLADRAEDAQAGEVVLGGDVVSPLHEGADRGGGGVEEGDLVLLDDLPEAALVGGVGGALVHDLGGAVGEGAVDDVGVAGDPADVGGAPEDVGLGFEVEDGPVGVGDLGEVAAGGVQDALGLPRRAGGVEDEQGVFGVERLGGVFGGLGGDEVVPPHVAGVVEGDVLAGAAHDEDVFDVAGLLDGFVDGGFEGGGLAAAVAAVAGDDDLGVGVLDAGGERVGGEAAEDDGVGGADAGAGQHGDGGLGDHRHVDGDPVALADAEVEEGVRGAGDLVLEFGVGDGAAVAGFALEVDGDPVSVSGLDVPVHAVVGDVESAVLEPFREGGSTSPASRSALWPRSAGGPARPRSRAGQPWPAHTPPP